jgi:hypothetical protein
MSHPPVRILINAAIMLVVRRDSPFSMSRSCLCRIFTAAGIAVLATSALAQTALRIPVRVVQDGEDVQGKAFVSALRTQILASAQLGLVETLPHSAPSLVVHVRNADPDGDGAQTFLVIAITYDSRSLPFLGYLISDKVLVCVPGRVKECAGQALDDLNTAIGFVQLENRHLWQELHQ